MKYVGNVNINDVDLADLVGPFDMKTNPPVRNGVYITQHDNYDSFTFQTYNGKYWGMYVFYANKATKYLNEPSSFQHGKWWGLKEKNL